MLLGNVPSGHCASCRLCCIFLCRRIWLLEWQVSLFLSLLAPLLIALPDAVVSYAPFEFHLILGSGVGLCSELKSAMCCSFLLWWPWSTSLPLRILLLRVGIGLFDWLMVGCTHCLLVPFLLFRLLILSTILPLLVYTLGEWVVPLLLLRLSLTCGLSLLLLPDGRLLCIPLRTFCWCWRGGSLVPVGRMSASLALLLNCLNGSSVQYDACNLVLSGRYTS